MLPVLRLVPSGMARLPAAVAAVISRDDTELFHIASGLCIALWGLWWIVNVSCQRKLSPHSTEVRGQNVAQLAKRLWSHTQVEPVLKIVMPSLGILAALASSHDSKWRCDV